MKNLPSLTTNKRHQVIKWIPEEERVIFNNHGKMSIDDLLIQVNKVSNVTRTRDRLVAKAVRMKCPLTFKPTT